jgi:hypothetical protein
LVNREIYSDGHREHWVLPDIAAIPEPLPLVRNMARAPALKNRIDN